MTENTTATQATALFREALALHHQGKLDAAKDIYERVRAVQPQHFEALHLLGVIAASSKNPELGADLIRQSLEIYPGNATAWCNLGNALSDVKNFVDAIESYDKAIAINPNYFVAHNGLGTALKNSMQFFSAIDSYSRAIVINSGYADAYANRALVYVEVDQYRNALSDIERALVLKPENTTILEMRKMAHFKFKNHQATIGSYADRGNTLMPVTGYLFMQGEKAAKEKQYEKALACFNELIAINPADGFAYFWRGNTLRDLNSLKAAIDSYDKAMACDPDIADPVLSCSEALCQIHEHPNAIKCVEQFLDVNPQYNGILYGYLQSLRMSICDWTDLDTRIIALQDRVQRGENATSAFIMIGLVNEPALHKKAAKIYGAANFARKVDLQPIVKYRGHQKIRIAYFSADFYNHATSYLMVSLFELHDRNKFEIIGISFGLSKNDEMRNRLIRAFDNFIDINDKKDVEVVQLCRNLEIDIAVDLKGYTKNSRIGVFSYRIAPIQVSYIGYPGTLGVDYFDYLIADKVLIPLENQKFFSEKIAYLPNSYQVNDHQREISEVVFSRAELGLPEEGFVFCCFNNNYKITPLVFDIWMRLLKRVEGSVLWLLEDNPFASANLCMEANKRGVDPSRLVFAARMPLAEHLARHRVADLFLDTLPYNAHTTASDALWAGLPVLTCMGESFAGRVAASLLSALDLTELITPTLQAYEALAFELVCDPIRLNQIKQKLSENRLTKPLFDTALFATHIEAAYTAMYQRYQADLPPEHIFIQ